MFPPYESEWDPMTGRLKARLLTTRISDRFIRERIDVTGWSEEVIQTQMGGLLREPDFDFKNWLIRDSGWKPD